MSKYKQAAKRLLGLEKQSDYVKEFFYHENMRAAVYMSVIVILLELWMILRMIHKIFTLHLTGSSLSHVIEAYLSNYFILLSTGILMLLYAVRGVSGRTKFRWGVLAAAACAAAVAVYEVQLLMTIPPDSVPGRTYRGYICNLISAVLALYFSVRFLADGKNARDKKRNSLAVMYLFSFVCLCFGIILSVNSYERGEQAFAFLTMEMYVICLLTWRPLPGTFVLTASYLVFFAELSHLVAFNSPDGKPGMTESTVINGFTLWLSTVVICFANHHKTRNQAHKSENLEKVNAHLSEISVRDELTGIHNMHYFYTEAARQTKYVTADSADLVYLFIDVENFKSYNGKYGFHEGNALLIKIAKMIESAFRRALVARFSDDHFVVLTRADSCEPVIEQLSEEIRNNQREVQLSLKCGAYHPAECESDPSLACDRARFACNSIKKHFGQTFRYYDQTLADRFRLRAYIVNNIDAAIREGYIQVYYQPIVSTADGTVCALEALARWQDPNYGLLPPGAFIPVLEEYRQIHKLDCCIVGAVCRDYRDSADNGLPFAPVSLNFSRLDFELCDITETLNSAAAEYGVPREYLEAEITESALSAEGDFLPKAVRALRENGYRVWLDDFGSGYSSLNVLKDYQFDVLKIDMKFLSGFDTNSKTAPILTNIIRLTEALNMVSLTEGVETQAQFDFLKEIGCGRAQGYLIGKPAPLSVLRERIANGELRIQPGLLNSGQCPPPKRGPSA